jgi:hypothetical protein
MWLFTIDKFIFMSEEQTERLNFYSKYNIARQKV